MTKPIGQIVPKFSAAEASALTVVGSPPSWALALTDNGDANAWFSGEDAARKLTDEQREHLPAALNAAERDVTGSTLDERKRLRDPLLLIGARVAPGTGTDAAMAWVSGLIDSFANYPIAVLERAVMAAKTKQFQFLNEVGPFIEGEANPELMRRYKVRNRLKETKLCADRLPKPTVCNEDPAVIEAEIEKFKAILAKGGSAQDEKPRMQPNGWPNNGTVSPALKILAANLKRGELSAKPLRDQSAA